MGLSGPRRWLVGSPRTCLSGNLHGTGHADVHASTLLRSALLSLGVPLEVPYCDLSIVGGELADGPPPAPTNQAELSARAAAPSHACWPPRTATRHEQHGSRIIGKPPGLGEPSQLWIYALGQFAAGRKKVVIGSGVLLRGVRLYKTVGGVRARRMPMIRSALVRRLRGTSPRSRVLQAVAKA